MADYKEQKEALLKEVGKLRERYELSKTVDENYFEPGMMEYLDQSYGEYDESSGQIVIRFEVKGTRYDDRTQRIERVKIGNTIKTLRDSANPFNTNNFTIVDIKGNNLGNMPAALCNALAPLYDAGVLVIDRSRVSYVEPLSRRSRHAKQAILFVELHIRLV